MRDKLWDEYRKKGVKFTAYDTLGPYDVVTIVESPTEEMAFRGPRRRGGEREHRDHHAPRLQRGRSAEDPVLVDGGPPTATLVERDLAGSAATVSPPGAGSRKNLREKSEAAAGTGP